MSATLTPGYYLVYATSIKAISAFAEETKNSPNQNLFSYNMVIHGQSRFSFNKFTLPSENISDIFYSAAKKSNKIRYELNGNLRTLIIPGSCTHGIIVENLSNYYFIKVSIDLSQSKNLESTRYSLSTEDLIAPGTRQLIKYLTPHNYRKGFVIGYRIETSIVNNLTSGNSPVIPIFYSGMHSIRAIE